jgi:hypothetical protein
MLSLFTLAGFGIGGYGCWFSSLLILLHLDDGVLLQGDLPPMPRIYQHNWPLASTQCFTFT